MNDLRVKNLLVREAFEDAFRHFLRPWRTELADCAPQIRVDLNEHEGNYTVKAKVPGVHKEDIGIRIDGNQLTVSAEVKKETQEKKGDRVLRSERQYGYASRSLWLDCPVDEAKVVAKYRNGVLELSVPKKAATWAKRLSIT